MNQWFILGGIFTTSLHDLYESIQECCYSNQILTCDISYSETIILYYNTKWSMNENQNKLKSQNEISVRCIYQVFVYNDTISMVVVMNDNRMSHRVKEHRRH